MADSTAAQDWTQWMQWDGEEQQSATHPAAAGDKVHTRSDTSNIYHSYLGSPSSTPNSDQSFLSILKTSSAANRPTNGPLTPNHSSSSPETPHLPESRLSGETLRSTSSAGISRLNLKRKSSDEQELVPSTEASTEAFASQQKPASKKRPHNVIEKRYRANLNDKIAELRQSVPSLCSPARVPKEADDVDDDPEDQSGSVKLNKASILTKAVEYIRHLELRNKRLGDENLALKQRLLKLERVLASDGSNAERRATDFTSENAVEETAQENNQDTAQTKRLLKHPPQGLIPVPESIKKLRQDQSQEHYGAVYDSPQEGQRGGRKWPGKFMLGSLAGLMILDGLGERQGGSESKARGLFGIPLEFMDGWWFLKSPRAFIAAFMQYCRAGGVIPLVKGFLALSLLAFFVFAYLFNSKPSEVEQDEKNSKLQRVPSLVSPIQVRRRAWLTSMRTLELPRHSFFPEWFAVTMEWLEYTIRLLVGFPIYSRITGRTEDDELARIKAWDIAIDAQLAGGDPEISRSRLILSIFASGTLPQTPTRLMLKALHCRVVLWKVGRDQGLVSRTSNKIAIFLADRQWKKARCLAAEINAKDDSALPAHLAELLRHDCQEVMLDAVLQRAYNLMYERSVDEAGYSSNSLMDVVAEDHAVRSPLDAIAAWWSSHKLHQALLLSLAENEQDQNLFRSTLDLALAIAPCLSAAYTRALAIKAVFVEQDRAMNVHRVRSALPTIKSERSSLGGGDPLRLYAPVFIDSYMPLSACSEVETILDCATIMVELHNSPATEGFANRKRKAADLLASLDIDPTRLTLLSFAPAVHVILQFFDGGTSLGDHDNNNNAEFSHQIRSLMNWAHSESPDATALSPGIVNRLNLLCKQCSSEPETTRRQSSGSNDTGYESLSDPDAISQ